jgi:DNA end-binding protein Ku
MAPRANWKGYLKLSLVSCPVALFPASSTATRVSFNTLNRKTGNRVKQVYVDPDTRDEVPSEDQVKGYAIGKDNYLMVEASDLEGVQIESSRTIDIEKFVPRDEIDPRYMDAPYYIAPDDRVGQEAFSVIREAMRESGKVAIGRVVIARRERVVMIEPWRKGLLATLLRYGTEVRDDAAYFDEIPDVPVSEDMKEMAEIIIARRSGHFLPDEFEDRYENALVEMMRSKQEGQPSPATVAPRPGNVVNLLDALRRSVEAEKRGKTKASPEVEAKVAPKAKLGAEPKPGISSRTRRSGGKELFADGSDVVDKSVKKGREKSSITSDQATVPASRETGGNRAGKSAAGSGSRANNRRS